MTCAESRLLLHAHADRELDLANSRELERHIAACAVCAAEEKSVQSLKTALRRSSLRYEAPEFLRKEMRQMARGASDEPRPSFLQSLRLWRSVAFGMTALALAAILLGPAGSSEQKRLVNEAVASHIRSLMAEHLTDVASTDQHTVKPWFNGKLDFAPDVKDFAVQGFPLVGGRLDYLQGRTVAALVYRRNKHFINVFIWPAASAASGRLATETLRGYSVISRDAKGSHYCLVSDLNPEELAQLAKLFEP